MPSPCKGRRLAIVAVTACALVAAPAARAANIYSVAGTSDSGSGSCSAFVCSDLRAAVAAANLDPGSTIELGSGTYELAAFGSGELQIGHDMTIAGAGPSLTTIEQTDGHNRVIDISAGTVEITGVTISGGAIVGTPGGTGAEGGLVEGGGIFNHGVLTLANDAVLGNSATGGTGGSNSGAGTGGAGGFALGGGIFSSGDLTITSTTIAANTATSGHGGDTTGTGNGGASHNADGGGIYENGALTVSSSTISGNTAAAGEPGTSSGGGATGSAGGGLGAGINDQSVPASILNSTIAANTATTPGGVAAIAGFFMADLGVPLTLASDTFAANQALGATTLAVANVFLETSTLTTADTLLVAGSGDGVNCSLTGTSVSDEGHNLEDDAGASLRDAVAARRRRDSGSDGRRLRGRRGRCRRVARL
jgi:hypothetical protein